MKIIEIPTTGQEALVDITEQAIDYVHTERLKDGILLIQMPDDTCGVTLMSDADAGYADDLFAKMNRFMPKYDGMRFTGWNTSRIKAALTGHTLELMVQGGELILGLHQRIALADFAAPSDGRRVYFAHVGTLLAEGEEPKLPEAVAELNRKDMEAEAAAKAEEERIIAEMRAEAAERARKYKEEQAAKEAARKAEEAANGEKEE